MDFCGRAHHKDFACISRLRTFSLCSFLDQALVSRSEARHNMCALPVVLCPRKIVAKVVPIASRRGHHQRIVFGNGKSRCELCARMACKPDSVTAWQPPMAIHLGPPSPTGSGSQPGSLGRENPGGEPPRDPYLALLLAGLAMPPTLPPARWALTPPFHPYPLAKPPGGLISVALSLGLPRAGVTRRHFSLESGLSSRANPRGHPAIRARSL